jgi:archaetidylinositol phosphate synthase
MLNKFRRALGPLLDGIGSFFAKSGISPNFWTLVSLLFAFASGLTYMSPLLVEEIGWYHPSLAGSILLLISGFFDIVDGNVARTLKQSSKKGAFLDSILDKISESFLFIGIAVGGLASPLFCQVAISLSLMVSYARSRSESMGIELKGVGIGERAERLLSVGFLGLIPLEDSLQYAVLLVCVLAGVTLCQRIIFSIRRL